MDSYQSDDIEGHESGLQNVSSGEHDFESPLFKMQDQAFRFNDNLHFCPTKGCIKASVPVDTKDVLLGYKSVEERESLPDFDPNSRSTHNLTPMPDMAWIEDLQDFDL